MAVNQPADNRRLTYVRAADLDTWQCRPFPTIDVLDLQDRPAGRLDGIVIDRRENRPVYLVIANRGEGPQPGWFLAPVGDAWFDETTRAVRVDVPGRDRIAFEPGGFEQMTPEQAEQYERRVLGACCPEVGFRADGTPDYERLRQFKCPTWLRSDD